MPKKKEEIEVKKMIQESGSIQVTKTTVVSGKEVDKEEKPERITVRPFLTQPAYVSMRAGETVPLSQPYANRKIEVSVSHPCYKEEMADVLKQVTEFVNDYVDHEVSLVEGAALKKEYPKKDEVPVEGKKEKATTKKEKRKKKPKKDDLDDLDDLADLLDSNSNSEEDTEDDELAAFI